jgi:hypothetical protein
MLGWMSTGVIYILFGMFAQRTVEQHDEEVFESANLSAAVMTNSPF